MSENNGPAQTTFFVENLLFQYGRDSVNWDFSYTLQRINPVSLKSNNNIILSNLQQCSVFVSYGDYVFFNKKAASGYWQPLIFKTSYMTIFYLSVLILQLLYLLWTDSTVVNTYVINRAGKESTGGIELINADI